MTTSLPCGKLQLEEDVRTEAERVSALRQQSEAAAKELQQEHLMLEVCSQVPCLSHVPVSPLVQNLYRPPDVILTAMLGISKLLVL